VLFVALPDGPTKADLTVVDADVEAALRAVANPRLEHDRSAIAAVVREWHKLPLLTFPALRQLEIWHRSPPLVIDGFTSPGTSPVAGHRKRCSMDRLQVRGTPGHG
jgi:hypothetical protein